MRDERPETHKLRLNALLVGDGAVILVFTVEALFAVVTAAVVDAAGASVISAMVRTENRKLIFN